MKKSSRLFYVILMAVLLCLSFTLTSCELPFLKSPSVSVTFGSEAAQSVEKGGSVTAPDFNPQDNLKVFLGWSTEEGKTAATDVMFAKGASISYDKLVELATENAVKFHPVVSTKKTIDLTWNGTGDHQTIATLIEGETPTLQAPAVDLGAKQEFLGWATSADATEAVLAPDALISYASVKALAANGALTLHPVVKTHDIVLGVIPAKFTVEDEEGNIIHDVNYYVDLVKADFTAAHPEASVLYRIYSGNVSECGAQILADGDVDVVMAGNNVDSASGAALTVIAKEKLASKYNSDGSRRGALLVNSELALDMYAMLIGAENKNVEVTIGTNVTVVNSALGNEVDTSGVSDPNGRVIVGWARTENAAEAEIVAAVLDYNAVAALANEGKITLYPVFGAFDLIVGVWGINGTNTYATDAQLAACKDAFVEYLAGKGITDAVLRFDMVSGSSKAENATYYPTRVADDVMVILGGSNVATQCETDGKYKVINHKFESTRYASVYTSRVTAEQQSFVDMFIEFLAEDTVEVTLGEAKTVVSLLGENAVDTSAVVVPAGKKIAGWALTADATEALILGAVLDYAAVSKHATEGKITVFPVFEDDVKIDLVFDVLFKSITQDQLDQLIADFKAHLAASGDTTEYNIVVRTDFSGKGADFLARVKAAGDVDVVLGASNLVEQTGAEIIVQGENPGAYGKLSAVAGSTRCVGMIEGCAHEELAIKFINFCQTAPAA